MKKSKSKIYTKDGILYKCSKCKLYLPADDFCSNRSLTYRDGVNHYCKRCQRDLESDYRKNLPKEDGIKLKLKHCLSGARSRAKRLNIEFNLTEEYIKYLWDKQNGLCALSGIPMTYQYENGPIETNASVDRIDSSEGYIIGNVQLTCWAVNRMKGQMDNEHLLYFCKNIVENNKKRF